MQYIDLYVNFLTLLKDLLMKFVANKVETYMDAYSGSVD